MKLGPFPERDLKQISEILTEAGIAHTSKADSELADKKVEEMRFKPPTMHPTPEFDSAYHFVEIDERDAQKIGNLLTDFGVVVTPFEPSFDVTEFICRKCGYTSAHPGNCPKHGIPLGSFSEYSEFQSDYRWMKFVKMVGWVVIPFIIALLYSHFIQ